MPGWCSVSTRKKNEQPRPCVKRGYRDRISALIALAGTAGKKHTRREKDEARAYRCPRCGKWHLTSRKARLQW